MHSGNPCAGTDTRSEQPKRWNALFYAKFSNADNHTQSFTIPGEGIYCDAGMYVDLTNCDFCTIIGTFT